MNRLERAIYKKVADFPWLRAPVVAVYQGAMSLLPAKSIDPEFPFESFEGYFFGFHDKIPWSHDNKYLLSHKFDRTKKLSSVERQPIIIGAFSCDDYKFRPLATSSSWNWQQGAMLQWLGARNTFIFNDYIGVDCARIFDIGGKEIGRLSRHIGAINADGEEALSFSFGRLCRGAPEYGYEFHGSICLDEFCPSEDGLWSINVVSGDVELLFSLEYLAAREPVPSMEGSYHFVTHTLYNPKGDKFLFLHRWRDALGRLHSRLYIYDLKTNALVKIPIHDSSHMSWYGDSKLFMYGWEKVDDPGYFIVDLEYLLSIPVDMGVLNVDGHPQVHANGLIVTDSYPDRFRMQRLYVYSDNQGKAVEVLKWRIPMKYRGARRCDFHPRWDRLGEKICIDTASSGVRALCVIDMRNSVYI